jgi:MFS family permease
LRRLPSFALIPALDTSLERANYRYTVIEGSLSAVVIQVITTYVPILALSLGATKNQLGVLYALPYLINILALLIGQRLVNNQPDIIRTTKFASFTHRTFLLLFMATPFIGTYAISWVIGVHSLTSAILAVSSSLWMIAVSDMFNISHRGSVFGTRQMFTGTVGMLAVLIAGEILDRLPFPQNYLVVFPSAIAIGMISPYVFGKMKTPPEDTGTDSKEKEKDVIAALGVWKYLKSSTGRKFLKIILPLCVFNIGYFMLPPVLNIYWKDYLQLSNFYVGLLASMLVLFQVIGSPVWGSLIDKKGFSWVSRICLCLISLQAFIYWFIPYVPYLILVQALGGLANGGVVIGAQNAMYNLGTRKERARLIVWYAIANGLSSCIGSIFGPWILNFVSFRKVCVLAGMIRFLAASIYLLPIAVEYWKNKGPTIKKRYQRQPSA